MSDRTQINIRVTRANKKKYQNAADADMTTPDLSTWIRRQCDVACQRFPRSRVKKSKGN